MRVRFLMTLVTGAVIAACAPRSYSGQVSSTSNTDPVFAPINVSVGDCRYRAELDEEIGGERVIRVSAGKDEGETSLSSLLFVPVKEIPLKNGVKNALKTRFGNQEWSYDAEKRLLKGVTKGTTDFLENQWIELTIDPNLQKPESVTVKWSMAVGIPFKTKSCRFIP